MAPPLRHAVLLALALPVTGLAGACTKERDDPPPPPPATSNAQIRQGVAALWAGDNPRVEDAADSECFAAAFLSRTTPEQLRDTGIIDDSGAVVTAVPVLDPGLAEIWVEAQFTCVDFVEESTRAVATQSNGEIDQTAYAACLGDEIDGAQIREALVAGLSGDIDNQALNRLSRAQLTCVRTAT